MSLSQRSIRFAVVVLGVLCYLTSIGQDTLHVSPLFFHTDKEKGLLLINQDVSTFDLPSNVSHIKLDTYYAFLEREDSIRVGKQYEVKDTDEHTHALYFTSLPVIHINSDNEVSDEPRVLADFELVESNGAVVSSKIGIEIRGGYSQTFDKNSLRIEFWEDDEGDDSEDFELLGMRSDDDWNLQAMFNEPMRIRNKSCFELWQQIDTLHYLEDEPKAINGVHYEYAELFLNGEYRGVYGVSERIDRKQLRIKKEDDDKIRGELYKGIWWDEAVVWEGAPEFNNNSETWSGFEYEYPDIIDWSNLHDVVSFTVSSDQKEFLESYNDRFDVSNLVNYFIFLNVTRAEDNTGKNIYVAKYNEDEPYFFVPWDLDGTYGMRWDGVRWRVTDDILSNGLYDRLLDDTREGGFVDQLKSRWTELRSSVITQESIMSGLQDNYNYLLDNAVYEREAMAWPNSDFLDTNSMNYTSDWLRDRLTFLDGFFDNLNVTTSTQDVPSETFFEVAPNPSHGDLSLIHNRSIKSVRVYDTYGRLYLEKNEEDVSRLLLTDTPAGVYFISVTDATGQIGTKRVILLH